MFNFLFGKDTLVIGDSHAHFLDIKKSENKGIPGEDSNELIARLPGLLKKYKPKNIVMSIGTNDWMKGIDESVTRQNLDTLAVLLFNYKVIYLQSPQRQMDFVTPFTNTRHIQFDLLKTQLEANPSLDPTDKIHLSPWGYQIVSMFVSEWIRIYF